MPGQARHDVVKRLVDRAHGIGGAQHLDRTLDLPPAAEMEDVAEGAALVGAVGGLRDGIFAVAGDQLGRFLERFAVGDMDVVTHSNAPFFPFPQKRSLARVGFEMAHSLALWTVHQTRRLEKSSRGCEGAPMDGRNSSQAAGSLVAVAIIAGVVGGVVAGEPSIGFLVGAAVGAALAALWWLKDRRR